MTDASWYHDCLHEINTSIFNVIQVNIKGEIIFYFILWLWRQQNNGNSALYDDNVIRILEYIHLDKQTERVKKAGTQQRVNSNKY